MSWGRLDDGYADNPKMLGCGLAATGLHARAIAYCAKHRTNGHLPEAWVHGQLAELRPAEAKRVLHTLVEQGAFEPNGSGYYLHDFLAYHPTKEELEAAREEERSQKGRAGRKGAETKWRRDRISQSHRAIVAERLGVAQGEVKQVPCEYCGTSLTVDRSDERRVRLRDAEGRSTPELDHVEPLAKGGANDAPNLVLACMSCNRSKGAK